MSKASLIANVTCGLFGTAEDHPATSLSLDELYELGAPSIFLFRAKGDSMRPRILPDDILIVDRSLTPKNGDTVIISYQGELICKKIFLRNDLLILTSDNIKYKNIVINDSVSTESWGVVIGGAWKS